jgi:hypothetical protein
VPIEPSTIVLFGREASAAEAVAATPGAAFGDADFADEPSRDPADWAAAPGLAALAPETAGGTADAAAAVDVSSLRVPAWLSDGTADSASPPTDETADAGELTLPPAIAALSSASVWAEPHPAATTAVSSRDAIRTGLEPRK